jgi:hypothetical protein
MIERMMRTLLGTTLLLLATSFWNGGEAYSAVSLVHRSQRLHSFTSIPALKNDQEEVDAVTAEAEDAVRAATALLQDEVPQPSSNSALTPEQQRQWIAATCSSVLVGGVLGFVVATQIDEGLLVEPLVGAGAVAAGAATFLLAQDADAQNLVALGLRYVLGKPLLAVLDQVQAAIVNQIETTKQEVAALPNKVQEKIAEQVRDTQRRVQQIPTQVQEKIQEKVSDTVATLQAIPVQVADAAQKAAEDALAEVQATPERLQRAALDMAEEMVTEIQATPDRLQKAALDMAGEVVTEIQATPERLSEQAQRLAEEVVAELKGGDAKIPQPPKRPPPMVPEAEATTRRPNVELPKMALPSLELPKVELPKITMTPASPDTRQQIQDAVRREQELLRKQREQELLQKDAQQKQEQMKRQKEQAALQKQRQQEQFEQQKRKLQEAQQLAERKTAAAASLVEQRRRQDRGDAQKLQERQRAELQRQEQERQKTKELERQKAEQQRQEREEERQKQVELQRRRQAEQEKKEALRRSQEIEAQKKKDLELERKKQEAAARQQKAMEKQVTAQVQKQQSNVAPGGSFRLLNSKLNRAPRGVPTVIQWKQRRDGGISGRIYGSANFKDGERIETSAIASGAVDNGFVVKTDSGSRYFLSKEAPNVPATSDAEGPLQALMSALPGATITLTKAAQEKTSKVATKKAAEPPARKKPSESVAQPRPTFSLFGGAIAPPSGETKAAPVSAAPRGVPTIRRWRVNRDGSVTGIIFGSSNFAEGERVTTSPIASGNLTNGSTVRTGSGSRYFLE